MSGSHAPIFLVGTGRCGSTIIYSLLAMHPELAWIPSWLNRLPRYPGLAVVNRLWGLPGMDRCREYRFFPKPVEPNIVFAATVRQYYSERFDEEVIREAQEKLVPVLEKTRRAQGKPRLLCKMVGRPVKIDLFAQLYPDAFFVHIVRDLKPTTSSLMLVDFYQPIPIEEWKWEPVPQEYLEYYQESGKTPEVAAAIRYKLNREAIQQQLEALDTSRWREVPYSQFVSDPVSCLSAIGRMADLEFDERFIRRLEARQVYRRSDEKWKRFFNDQQVRNLDGFAALAGIA